MNPYHFFCLQKKRFNEIGEKKTSRLDADEVHDLRVCTRRARAVLQLVNQVSSKKIFRTAYKSMKKVGAVFGNRRTLEVAFEGAVKYNMDGSELRNQIKASKKKIGRFFTKKQKKEISDLLEKSSKKLKKVHHFEGVLKNFIDEGEKWLTARLQSKDDFHQLRIEVKQMRYLLEVFGYKIPSLVKLQEYLGDAHDLEQLQRLLGKNLRALKDERVALSNALDIKTRALTLALKKLRQRANAECQGRTKGGVIK